MIHLLMDRGNLRPWNSHSHRAGAYPLQGPSSYKITKGDAPPPQQPHHRRLSFPLVFLSLSLSLYFESKLHHSLQPFFFLLLLLVRGSPRSSLGGYFLPFLFLPIRNSAYALY